MHPAKYSFLVILFIQQFYQDVVDGQCQPVFEKFPGRNAQNGQLQSPVNDYNTIEKCQSKCVKTTYCIALDFNTVSFQCYLFTDPSGSFPAQGINQNVDHYQLTNECQTVQCENGYSVHESLTSVGGSYQGPQLESIETCMARCESYSTCKGFEFRRVQKECYLYWAAVTLTPSNDAVHYSRGGCERCKVFRRYPNSNAEGGVEQGQFVDTIAECLDLCTTNDQCLAFDFRRDILRCYLLVKAFVRKYASNVEHYEKMECGPCYSGYSYFENLRAADGLIRNVDSLSACKSLCTGAVTCTGFNFMITSGTCETFVRSDVVLDMQEGTTYYARTNCFECSNSFEEKAGRSSRSGEQLLPTFMTKDQCLEKCRQRVDCYSVDFNTIDNACFLHATMKEEFISPNVNKYYKRYCGECYEGYTRYEKLAAGNGNVQLSIINTVQKCKDQCESYVSCIAFEFNSAVNKCYTFSANQTITYNNDVDHYVKTACRTTGPTQPPARQTTTAIRIQPTTVPPVKCRSTFEKVPNAFRSDGAQQPPGVNSVELCLDACTADTNCIVAEFHRNTFRCYFHSSMSNTVYNGNVDTYLRKECGACYYGFTMYENARGSQGTRLTEVSTLPECRKQCLKLASQTGNICFGFDFKKACYIYTSQVDLIYSEVENHYRFTGCRSCENTFTERLNSNAPGGARQSATMNSEALCKAFCRQDPQCAAFDFSASQCWFHATVPSSPTYTVGTNQFIKNKCGDCIEGYTEYTKARIVGFSQEQSSVFDTFAECRSACAQSATCTGFDLVKDFAGARTTTCYTTTAVASSVAIRANELSTHYRRTACGSSLTTPTANPNPDGVCVAGFSSFSGYKGQGNSITQTSFDTISACRERCRDILTCTGFNFHIRSAECLTFTLFNLEYVADVDYHFEKRSGCDGPVTQPGGTTMVPFQCIPVFAQRKNFYALGGEEAPSVSSVSLCLSICLTDPKCTAFDFTGSAGCYLHRSTPKSRVGTNVDQYIKTPCLGCDDGFSVFEGLRSTGGTDDQSFNTPETCRMRCLQFSSCVAFEFNLRTNGCTRYTKSVGNLVYDENTVHYRKVACSGCLDTFKQVDKTNMFNGIIQEDIRSAQACRAFCLSKPYSECLAYDWDRVRSECFIHTRLDSTGSNNDVDLFRREQCYETTTLDPAFTGKPLDCPPTEYRLMPGKMSLNGIPQDQKKNTVDECLTACTELDNCAAMDFSRAGKACWLFLQSSPPEVDTSNGVDHYEKLPCRPCQDGYTLYQDERGSRGDRQPGTFTMEGCRSTCDAQPTCSAFDYSRVDKECYIYFFQLDTLTSSSASGFDHFRKTSCITCNDRFDEIEGIFSTAIVNAHEVDVSSALQCQLVCRRIFNCVASDYRNQINNKRCIIHTDVTDLESKNLIQNGLYIHYRRVPCNLDAFMSTTETSCIRQFNSEFNTYYNAGGRFEKTRASTSREACERACRFETSCVAYEWDKKILVCYMHYKSQDLTSASRVRRSDIDHYRKSERCASSTEPQAVVGGSSKFQPLSLLICTLACLSAYTISWLRT